MVEYPNKIIGDFEANGLKATKSERFNFAYIEITDDFKIVGFNDYWGLPVEQFLPVDVSAAIGIYMSDIIIKSEGRSFLEHEGTIKAHMIDWQQRGLDLVGHNIAYDLTHLDVLDGKVGDLIYYNPILIDSMKIFNRKHPSRAKNLKACMDFYNISHKGVVAMGKALLKLDTTIFQQHTGLFDCLGVFLLLKKMANSEGVTTLHELAEKYQEN